MSKPVIRKEVGINPDPCDSGYDKLGPTERRNWQNSMLHHSNFIQFVDNIGGPIGGDTTNFYESFTNVSPSVIINDNQTNNYVSYALYQSLVVRFKLRATLTTGGSASAYPQYAAGPAPNPVWTDITNEPNFKVYDSDSQWSGSTGDIGFARRFWGDSEGAEIIWMEPNGSSLKMVQVNHSGGTAGHLKAANASGVHPGRIVTFTNGTKANSSDIWILFVDHYDTDTGAVVAEQGRFYGPALLSGTLTVSSDARPLYVCHVSEHQYLAQSTSAVTKGSSGTFKLYHTSTEADSGLTVTAECKFNAYTANKWAIVTRINGQYYANQIECD